MNILGIDTSNYTTSAALFSTQNGFLFNKGKLLPVKPGELGLRQSDAVFHHTVQLPQLLEENLCEEARADVFAASASPMSTEGSYMPCFLVGSGTAVSMARVCGKPLHLFSHQQGHIAAALFSADKLCLLNEKFIAFHVSGGTTQAVLVSPGADGAIETSLIAASSDLKAGQLIDRTGKLLGLQFPAGIELDALSRKSGAKFKVKPHFDNGNCSLSGFENKCVSMKAAGAADEDIALFCIECIAAALEGMTEYALRQCGSLPLVYSGGVMSNSIISARFGQKYGASFAAPEFSRDNAAGLCILAAAKENAL